VSQLRRNATIQSPFTVRRNTRYPLQGLGSYLHYAEFDVVVCADCGLTRFFAEPAARENVRGNSEWKHLSPHAETDRGGSKEE
jgi:hypothetical protein